MNFQIVLAVFTAISIKVTISAGIGRIANGSQAAAGELPWIVSISENAQHICGGFIYNDRFIVSAASCLFGKTSINLKVKAGATSLTTPGPYDQNIAVYSFLVHPNYDPITKKNDLALVLIDRPVVFNNYVKALRYDEMDETVTTGSVAGFGATIEGGFNTVRLQKATVFNLTADCQSYSAADYSANYMICAGDGTNSPCEFDQGTPLVQKTSAENIAVGIMSKTKGCTSPYPPAIYTRLSAYYAWLKQNAGQQPATLP